MAEDWFADVRKYDNAADEGIVAGIVKHCGIALRTRDASLVSFSDSKETDRVRESFLKKKLALKDSDAALDAVIASVGERMADAHDKNRVTVYYLLAQHFGLLGLFAGKAKAGAVAATTAAASGVAAAAATSTAATAQTPISTAMSSGGGHPPTRPSGRGSGGGGGSGGSNDMFGIGCIAGLVMFGAIIVAALISVWASSTVLTSDEAPPAEEPAAPAAPAPAPAPAAAPVVPEGAGVTATERDGKPMLTVYFDTGAAEVSPDFEALSSDVTAYLAANPDATVQISGFNDPTGNAAINEELSKNRAQNVQAALVALGVEEGRTDLVKPDDATTTDMTNAEARRVEITIVDG